MITRALSQKLVLLVIGLAAGSGILIPSSYGSFHPVTSSEIQDGTILSVDIGTSQVKAVDIAPDAVGGSELIGVTKLLFGQCVLTSDERTTVLDPNDFTDINCTINGVDSDDSAVATMNDSTNCYYIADVTPETNNLQVIIVNGCGTAQAPGSSSSIAVIVYDK